jgi:hypothetical protein
MANKKIQFDVGVKTDQLDQATNKVGELKRLSNTISIQYDINGKPLDVVIDKSLNLRKQVVELTKALRSVKEGSNEFRVLSTALGDANDKLAASNAKSRDLLGSLQLIPGPIGQIASQLNGAISALKLFSGFSLKDIGFQIKELNGDLTDIVKNLFGVGGAANKAKAELADTAATGLNTVAEVENTAATGENTKAQLGSADAKGLDVVATKRDTITTLENSLAEIENTIAIEKSTLAKSKDLMMQYNAIAATGGASNATLEQAIANDIETSSERINTLEKQKNTVATEISTTKTQLDTLTKEANIGVTARLSAAIRALAGSVLFWVGVLAAAGYAVYKYLSAQEELTKEEQKGLEVQKKSVEIGQENLGLLKNLIVTVNKSGLTQREKNKAVNEYNEKLGETLGKVKTYDELEKKLITNGPAYVKYLEIKAKAEAAYALSVETTKQALLKGAEDPTANATFFDRLSGIIESENYGETVKKQGAINRDIQKKELEKTANDYFNLFTGFQKEANDLADQLKLPIPEIKLDKGGTKGADDAYQKLISDLDAQIQLEINKENTRREVLQGLLDKKRKLVTDHDKLTYNQVELLKQENSKKIEAALDDDNKVLFEKLKKQEEIRVAAIDDEEQRELDARANQLYYDKIALQQQFKTQEEFDEASKNLQIKTDRDLLDIRDKFFQKRFKQEQDAFARQQELITKGAEIELAIDQQRIDDKTNFVDVYGDFFFGNKGLKAIWEKYSIDMRDVYQEEYDANMERYSADEEQLNTNLNNKVITQATYDEQLIQLNDKRTAAFEKNVQKQLELDKLEKDSKRANADALVMIGTNLVGLLGALNKKSKDMQIASAIVEAGVAIAKVIIDTQRSIIAYKAAVAPLGPVGDALALQYAVRSKIGAGIAIATIVASGIGKLKEIQSSGGEGGGGGQQSSSTTRGMARGGYIDGPRHAGGGVMVNAEGGEAVMTRGAVSMFGPMLSMMNQAGGGVSFNSNLMTTRQDNPILSNPAQDQAPIVVKTYVVEKDMVSQMNKQARLKDLSTL